MQFFYAFRFLAEKVFYIINLRETQRRFFERFRKFFKTNFEDFIKEKVFIIIPKQQYN